MLLPRPPSPTLYPYTTLFRSQLGLPATGLGEGSAGSTGGRECPGRSGLFMSGATPDADILGLMHAGDGAHGLRARAPDTLVPLRPPLTFNLAFHLPWWAPQAPPSPRLDGFELLYAATPTTESYALSLHDALPIPVRAPGDRTG